ncbi:MAG: hypothetical protein Q8O82_12595 [Pseudorhodobacter sp.]|nr:hypothetical protein [Pseudorhodobacter sp.]
MGEITAVLLPDVVTGRTNSWPSLRPDLWFILRSQQRRTWVRPECGWFSQQGFVMSLWLAFGQAGTGSPQAADARTECLKKATFFGLIETGGDLITDAPRRDALDREDCRAGSGREQLDPGWGFAQ